MGFLNRTFGKKELGDLVFDCFTNVGLSRTTEFLDNLKDFGFRYATMGGVSVGVEDLEIPPEKTEILREADEQVTRFQRAYSSGFISNGERYNKVIDTWTHANNDVADAMVRHLERSKNGFNPVYMMMTSGARGNRDQMRQLAGMRGLMAKPQKKLTGGIGEIIESPIKSNFREGLTVVEYFISTHGARKGLADTALKTADAGYLTRRLVDVAQDLTVTEEDCGTILGLEQTALKEGEDIIEPLRDRIVGNVALEDVYDPIDGELLVEAGELIEEDAADAIEDAGIQAVKIRSVLTCEAKRGICRQCYAPESGHHADGGRRGGCGDSGRSVHRGARDPADSANLPHRWNRGPYRGPDPAEVQDPRDHRPREGDLRGEPGRPADRHLP